MTVARSCSAFVVVIELVVVVIERGGRGGGGRGSAAAAADSGGGGKDAGGGEPHGTMVERISVGSTEPLFVMGTVAVGTVAVGRTTSVRGCGGCGGVEVAPSP